MKYKKCATCGELIPITNYNKDKNSSDGLRSSCKSCVRKYNREQYAKHKEKRLASCLKYRTEHKEQKAITDKKWREKNKERKRENDKLWREKNQERKKENGRKWREKNRQSIAEKKKAYAIEHRSEIKEKKKAEYEKNKKTILQKLKASRNTQEYKQKMKKYKIEYNKKNKDKINDYFKIKRDGDISFRIASNLRARINHALKNGSVKKCHTLELIGTDISSLSIYLLNIGYNPSRHHIDHIIPLSAFDLTDKYHQLVACHYMNLQPLTPEDNTRKKDSIPNGWRNIVYDICKKRNIDPTQIINHIASRG